MKTIIKINEIGRIQQGNYLNWFVKVIDDSNGETGGYYISIFKNVDQKGEAYDDWLEKFEDVEEYFKEVSWIINWENL